MTAREKVFEFFKKLKWKPYYKENSTTWELCEELHQVEFDMGKDQVYTLMRLLILEKPEGWQEFLETYFLTEEHSH